MPRQPKKKDDASAIEGKPLSFRADQFCREFMLDQNATQAAIRAGFAQGSAKTTASHLMKDPRIIKRIEELREERNTRLEFKADEVVANLVATVRADPRKLTRYCAAPCRYCWGVGHQYQWRTQREFDEAVQDARAKKKRVPDRSGGFGYTRNQKPNPSCPECDGYGYRYTLFTPTDEITGDEVHLFQGVKETKDGLQFQMADKSKALERLADYLGIYDKRPEDTANTFAEMLAQLLRGGSKAPIYKDPPPDDDAGR